MSIQDAMQAACRAVGIQAPPRVDPGRTRRVRVEGKPQSNRSGAVKVDSDGAGGVASNFITAQYVRFSDRGASAAGEAQKPRRDPAAERLDRERRQTAEAASAEMVSACAQEPHPYLAAKGFPEETGLVLDSPFRFIPDGEFFDGMRYQLRQMAGPFLIVPGRIAKRVVTVQLIDTAGAKLNMKAAPMKGAAHRIATGRETWVCEGIATALSVRAALRLLGRPATVLSAFSAANVATVAGGLSGSIIAADHDKPLEQLHGKGTGEFYAAKTGRVWVQPPTIGDFNDMHMSDGLRAVALRLREVPA